LLSRAPLHGCLFLAEWFLWCDYLYLASIPYRATPRQLHRFLGHSDLRLGFTGLAQTHVPTWCWRCLLSKSHDVGAMKHTKRSICMVVTASFWTNSSDLSSLAKDLAASFCINIRVLSNLPKALLTLSHCPLYSVSSFTEFSSIFRLGDTES
jgi:hypothetical protein